MENLIVAKSPHVTSSNKTRTIMLDVCIALLPALAASAVFFGLRALAVAAVGVFTAFIAELLYGVCFHSKKERHWFKRLSVWDCSCLVTGLLVALNVPAALPLWMVALGSLFAIVIVKMLFGGIGKNFVNPALAARIFLMISFTAMAVSTPIAEQFQGLTNYSHATWLSSSTIDGTDITMPARSGYWAGAEWWKMLIGFKASCAMGETSIIALLIGYVYLCVRKVINWRYPLIIVSSAALFAFLFDALPNAKGIDLLNVTVGHVLSGGLVFGAIFMATDYTTSPNTIWGSVLYCVAIGLIAVLIRLFGAYPEGMSFAILIMNVLTPLIDKFMVPRPFGYVRARRAKVPKTDKKKVEPLNTEGLLQQPPSQPSQETAQETQEGEARV